MLRLLCYILYRVYVYCAVSIGPFSDLPCTLYSLNSLTIDLVLLYVCLLYFMLLMIYSNKDRTHSALQFIDDIVTKGHYNLYSRAFREKILTQVTGETSANGQTIGKTIKTGMKTSTTSPIVPSYIYPLHALIILGCSIRLPDRLRF